MVRVLVLIFVIALVVFAIEKIAQPDEWWRNVFRIIALIIACVALLSLVVPLPF